MLDEEPNERRKDAIDLVVDGFKEQSWFINEETGELESKVEFNPDIPWYKGHIINQPFGRYTLILERLLSLALNAKHFMYVTRANPVTLQLIQIVKEHKRSIDSKSSEIYKDDKQNQSALIHILSHNKVERQYTIEGDEKKKDWLASFIGNGGS